VERGVKELEVFVNPKTLPGGVNVIQLETGVAIPIKFFSDSLIINVPRSRFLPVKKTCDLMLVMSNLYALESGTLTMSQSRMYKTTPTVELGDQHFKKVGFFKPLFVHPPSPRLI
jgi:UTP--glucose-1-phosphate uridylyltransferase